MAKKNKKAESEREFVTIEEFRADPSEVSKQALSREVEIVVSDKTSIFVARRVTPLD